MRSSSTWKYERKAFSKKLSEKRGGLSLGWPFIEGSTAHTANCAEKYPEYLKILFFSYHSHEFHIIPKGLQMAEFIKPAEVFG